MLALGRLPAQAVLAAPRAAGSSGAVEPPTAVPAGASASAQPPKTKRTLDASVPGFKEFIAAKGHGHSHGHGHGHGHGHDHAQAEVASMSVPFGTSAEGGKFYVETYGCQMNVNDTEIVESVMKDAGYSKTADETDADVIFVNTCAIRENAESKVWHRLAYFKNLKLKRSKAQRPAVGVLGCMAERLKTKLLESDKMVDIVAGPDSYRALPQLLQVVRGGEQAVNVQLSQEETYADIAPVRNEGQMSAFLSVMRGCNNMCAFCIVPFTRGRERSRPVDTIVDEVKKLAESGCKEIVLLGQNVNSYHDKVSKSEWTTEYTTSRGFSNLYRLRGGEGVRFAELVDRVTAAAPETRIRFTSPHPKDFPDELIQLMAERPNFCRSIHLPAQSGSSLVLERMRRGYSREAYLDLAHLIRDVRVCLHWRVEVHGDRGGGQRVPGVSLSSDFISGFCGETDADHADTISLIKDVQYEQAFMFAYSMREKTHAYHRLSDDVPEEVKQARLKEVIETFRAGAAVAHGRMVGSYGLLLVEGPSKRSTPARPELVGRLDNNTRCMIPDVLVAPNLAAVLSGTPGAAVEGMVPLKAGDYVLVKVTGSGVTSVQATGVARTTIAEHWQVAHAGMLPTSTVA